MPDFAETTFEIAADICATTDDLVLPMPTIWATAGVATMAIALEAIAMVTMEIILIVRIKILHLNDVIEFKSTKHRASDSLKQHSHYTAALHGGILTPDVSSNH
jgi:hypothetical protein